MDDEPSVCFDLVWIDYNRSFAIRKINTYTPDNMPGVYCRGHSKSIH